ncbi:hypothetical protein K458DRAFT_456763 [Lentithecium fluviatile CBS 122367]|uniref:Uncharacterized protein n=1 Tax=Lentithecium fluviatile CBS 122367 TaxID=1168545 RepID=A0A6G1IUB7_9PLEO|nr:hypothetical protein K458DRAFT_456763 [Lentithecium fluviatile CBS 122367]
MNQAEDVEFVLAHNRVYKFHSGTLARNSLRLANMLTEPLAAKLSNNAKNVGVKVRWMIELKAMPTHDYPAGRLGLAELNPTGERADGRTGLIINENGRVPTKIFDHYEAILYAFYNKEIRICDTDILAALAEAIDMIGIAKYLGCVTIISKPVEVALMKHGQALFRSVQSMPVGWVEMALDIRSETIFRECVIHLAGNWKKVRAEPGIMGRLKEDPAVRHLVERYHRRLVAKGKMLETSVMSIYPGDLATPSKDLPIKREEYSKDILVWMALTFFRHWLGQRIISQKGYHADDGGYELYKQLGTAGEAYMDKHVMYQFHAKFPMTKKAMNVLENHLLEIKECIKGVVDKHCILASTCMLDIKKYPVPYLTCVEFEQADLPWAGAKRGRRPGGNDIARENLEAARRMQARQEKEEGLELDEDEELDEYEEGGGEEKRARYE